MATAKTEVNLPPEIILTPATRATLEEPLKGIRARLDMAMLNIAGGRVDEGLEILRRLVGILPVPELRHYAAACRDDIRREP